MQLEFKPDWEETKDRYRAFWAHEYFGRAAIAVTAPLEGVPDEPWPTRPATPHERWTDLDYASASSSTPGAGRRRKPANCSRTPNNGRWTVADPLNTEY